MKYGEMAKLVREDPNEAKAAIRAGLKTHHADVKLAAEAFGVSWRSLYRWIGDLGMLDEVEKLRKKIGICPHCKRLM